MGTEEFKKAIHDFRVGLRPEQSAKLFKVFDRDGSGTIDYDEFVEVMDVSGRPQEIVWEGVTKRVTQEIRTESGQLNTKLDGEFIELNGKYDLLDNKIEVLDSKLDGELVDLRGEMSDISSKLDMILASLK